jgi:hypothetical protein
MPVPDTSGRPVPGLDQVLHPILEERIVSALKESGGPINSSIPRHEQRQRALGLGDRVGIDPDLRGNCSGCWNAHGSFGLANKSMTYETQPHRQNRQVTPSDCTECVSVTSINFQTQNLTNRNNE